MPGGRRVVVAGLRRIDLGSGGAFFVGAKSGQVVVQKMDDEFFEGTFGFTAKKDGEKKKRQDIDESKSDGSANAFEASEEVKE